jgi:hypothetical protein
VEQEAELVMYLASGPRVQGVEQQHAQERDSEPNLSWKVWV